MSFFQKPFLPAPLFSSPEVKKAFPNLIHGFFAGWPKEKLRKNLFPWEHKNQPPLLLGQPHGKSVLQLEENQKGTFPGIPGHDGAWFQEGNFSLVIRTADCVPVLAVNTHLKAISGLHAGWRGASLGILSVLLQTWEEIYGSKEVHKHTFLALGPSIGPCCFEVREDCFSTFLPKYQALFLEEREKKFFLNLRGILGEEAQAEGLPKTHVEEVGGCTFCSSPLEGGEVFASYRRSMVKKKPYLDSNLSLIGRGDGC